MSDKVFIDTNVLIYYHSQEENQKKHQASALFKEEYKFVISTQVVNEFVNVMLKKLRIEPIALKNTIDDLSGFFTIENINTHTIQKALDICTRLKFSYFDSLIIASALESQCTNLYSEDMHNGQIINNQLKIINPFI